MPTLRDQLMGRRNAYLERIAIFDEMECLEPVDIRVVQCRSFLEGGDDIPPECEEQGIKRERRRIDLSQLTDAEKAAAHARLNDPEKNQPSDEGDWDRFVDRGGTDYGPYRIAAQLVRATEYWQKKVVLRVDQVLDLQVTELPPLEDSPESVPKAWMLLHLCGCDDNILKRSYQAMLDKAGGVQRAEGNGTRDISAELSKTVNDWLNSFWCQKPAAGQKCPSIDPLPPRLSNTQCPCQPQKPLDTGTSNANQPPQPPSLAQALLASTEAVLAAFNTDSAQSILDDFRAIRTDDLLVAQILLWLQERWNEVPLLQKYDSASVQWQIRNEDKRPQIYNDPDLAPPPGSFASAQWSQAKEKFNALRAVPQYFKALSQKKVREVCVEIFKSLWPTDDDMPFKKSNGDNDTDLAKLADLNRDKFYGAIDRAAAPARDDCPFRLAALLQAPEAYMRVLDQLPPSAENGTGADGLARPTYDPLSAFYWRTTVVPKTIGHILTMKDTADFHAVEHIRFLGLFRPGGKYRTGKPENQDYEDWIEQFVPAWLTDFMKAALLRFKYWLDDKPLGRQNEEEMTYWSENHQMLFGSTEYIAGAWWHDEVFTYTGKGNSWHYNRALLRVRAWLDHRLQFGFSEVNSGTYYAQHLPGIFNLVDFSQDEEIRKKALMVMDLMVFDIVRRTCQGSFVAASGRAYWGSKRSGWSVSLPDFIQVVTGTIGDHWNAGENVVCSFVTSQYLNDVPEALIAMGIDRSTPVIDRSRTSNNLQDGPQYGLDYESSDSIVFWWGCGAYFTKETFDATESWSYRWGLRQTDPFKLFKWIDNAIVRLLYAVVGLLSSLITFNIATFLSGVFPLNILSAVMLTPRLLRSLIDVVLSFVDAYIIEIIVQTLKWAGALDENDDCVRVARPAIEEEFRALAIEFNRGSVLGRQHIYGWRSADAMLTSLIDDNKGGTSFQKESCIANLGMNVSVFTGKRLNDPGVWSTAGNIVEGFGQGLAQYAYNPDTSIVSQIPFTEGEAAPEIGRAAVPIFGSKLGNDGPAYWFGNVSAPLVFQHENVAISIYSPTAMQKDLAPESTHAHWPWDHFDEVRTEERNGGRWVFGRRDRRFPPRTPCQPRPERRPSTQTPWPSGKWREERGAGSGYIALFSARGMKTTPAAGQDVYDQLVKDGKTIPADPAYYGHRELIADGHENIWITIVGDRMTYSSFDAFCSEVLAAQLDVDVDHLKCSIAMPLPGFAERNENGPRFEVSWDGGGKIDGQEIKTDAWPRFEQENSSLKAQQGLSSPTSDLRVRSVRVNSKADPAKGRVDWDEKAWRIEVSVLSWQQVKDEQGRINHVQVPALLYLEHDFTQENTPRRETSPDGIQVFRDPIIPLTSVEAGTLRTVLPPAKSVLGSTFRQARSNFKLRRR